VCVCVCVAVCCGVLQCVAVCCSVLQCVGLRVRCKRHRVYTQSCKIHGVNVVCAAGIHVSACVRYGVLQYMYIFCSECI